MQRKDVPLGHTERHLLVQVVSRINQRAVAGSVTRLIKVRAHRAEPLNEQADTLAAKAAESDDSRPIELDLDPEGQGEPGTARSNTVRCTRHSAHRETLRS